MLLDRCYSSFVNLDHRKDRLKLMEVELRQQKISATRTRGMLPGDYKGDPKRVEKMRKRTPGAIGCYFSEVEIMRKALSLGQHAFVMEDDLQFCSDFHDRMLIIEEFTTTTPWDIIWLFGTFHINPPYWHKTTLGRDALVTDHPRMVRTFGAFSTTAYIVNVRSLVRVLSLLDYQLDTTIGIDYSFIQIQPLLNTFAFVPGCIIQRDNLSDIGSGITKFSQHKKLGPYVFQDKMGDFDPTTFNWHEANPVTTGPLASHRAP